MRSWTSLGVLLIVLTFATSAVAQVYTWTDENGVVHYTADPWTIPPKHRPSDLPAPAAPRAPGGWNTWGVAPAVTVAEGITVRFTPGEPIVVSARLNGVPSRCCSTPGRTGRCCPRPRWSVLATDAWW